MMQYFHTFHKSIKIQTECNQASKYSKELDYKKTVNSDTTSSHLSKNEGIMKIK